MKNENNKIVRKNLSFRIVIPFITVLLIVAFGGVFAYGLLNVEPSDIKTKCLIIIAYSLMCIMMIISTLYALLWKIEINGQDVIIRAFSIHTRGSWHTCQSTCLNPSQARTSRIALSTTRCISSWSH